LKLCKKIKDTIHIKKKKPIPELEGVGLVHGWVYDDYGEVFKDFNEEVAENNYYF
jgi:hypothetical protein